MKLRFALVLSVLAFSLHSAPYVGYVYPCGIQAGTTNRIIVGGQRLGDIRTVWFSGEGLKVINTEKVPSFPNPNGNGQRKWLTKRLYDIAASTSPLTPSTNSIASISDEDLRGWNRCPWWEQLETLDPLKFSIVTRDFFTPKNRLQMSAALGERLILTVVADKQAQEGRRDLVLLSWRSASVPHPFFVTSAPHVSDPLHHPPARKNFHPPVDRSVHAIPLVLDGQIMPGECDSFRLSLKGGDELCCKLTGREFAPYLGDAVPGFFNPVMSLFDDAGHLLACVDDFYYLPDPILRYPIPSNGVYRVEVRDNLYRGREDFVYSVVCTINTPHDDTPQSRAFVCNPPTIPNEHCESFLVHRGEVASHEFTVEKAGKWDFEVLGRRLGSPIDPVLRLYGPISGCLFWKNAPLIATWDDYTNGVLYGSVPQTECDPRAEWNFTEPGKYRLEVSDRIGDGGENFGYKLKLGEQKPNFEAFAPASSFVLTADRRDRFTFKLRVVRHGGFAGPIYLEDPEGLKVVSGMIPPDCDEAEVSMTADDTNWSGMKTLKFVATGVCTNVGLITTSVIPADGVEQAFAYHHLLPAHSFFVYRHPPQTGNASAPTWPPMPVDGFMPHRVIYRDRVPLVPIPPDDWKGVLLGKMAISQMHYKSRTEAVAIEPHVESDTGIEATLSVLSGITRFVKEDLSYADGDDFRVRTFAIAASNPSDNDLIVLVPSLTARRSPLFKSRSAILNSFCFDFADPENITNAPCGIGAKYRAVYVPRFAQPLPTSTCDYLDNLSKKRRCLIVYAGENDSAKKDVKLLASRCRREFAPNGLRFARFGNKWGEAWYFVYNPTDRTIAGNWDFNLRGKARTAYAMDVRTGKVNLFFDASTPAKSGRRPPIPFCSFLPHSSTWLFVSAFSVLTPDKAK